MNNTQYSSQNITAVVIDMQYEWVGIINPDLSCKKLVNGIIPAQRKTLETVVEQEIPIILVEWWTEWETEKYNRPKTITPITEIVQQAKTHTTIKKNASSAFRAEYSRKNTEQEMIRALQNRPYILMMGISANCCVKATAKDAITRGFTIVTAKDLIADSGGKTRFWKEEDKFYTSTPEILHVSSHEEIIRRLKQPKLVGSYT